MRYGKFLHKNGTIGFVSPSYGCATEPYRTAFAHALEKFEGEGFKTIVGPNCYKTDGVGISSTPSNCAGEFMEQYLGEPDVLLSCGGGELMCEILPFMDFEALKKAEPKWFMGYSDNTNLGFTLATICDVASIYGPNAASFGMEPRHRSIDDAFDLLTGKKTGFSTYEGFEIMSVKDETNPLAPYNITKKETLRFDGAWKDREPFRNGESFGGRLIGGCLDCLINLCGTRFDNVKAFNERYKNDGIVWFLESCELGIMGIRRGLWQLKQAGWFENVKGFIIGRPMLFEIEDYGLDRYTAVTSVLSELGVPIVLDVDLGHLPPSIPLVNGSVVRVTASGEVSVDIEMGLKS